MYTQRYTATSNAGGAQRKRRSFFKTRRPPTSHSHDQEPERNSWEEASRAGGTGQGVRGKQGNIGETFHRVLFQLPWFLSTTLINSAGCFFFFLIFAFSRLRASLKQGSGCKIEWLLSLPHLSSASLLLRLPSLHPRSLQSSHFLHFRAKEHSGDRQQGFYSTWSSPQKKRKKDEEQKLGEARLSGYDLNAYLCYNSYNQHQRGTKIK